MSVFPSQAFLRTQLSFGQLDWTSDHLHPAQYWSGPSQLGTVIMLVRDTSSAEIGSKTLVRLML